MRERPILFSGPMIRAILAGHKTMTRRPVKPQPIETTTLVEWNTAECRFIPWQWFSGGSYSGGSRTGDGWRCPYGAPGDRLWVRETWGLTNRDGGVTYPRGDPGPEIRRVRYRADEDGPCVWRPSIHMRRADARLVLEVTDVRVERLRAITEQDARAEGFADGAAFMEAWREMYPDGDLNPWIWVVSFRRVDGSRDA